MPIRREFRRFYGRTWRILRPALLARVGHRCECCGRSHPKLNVAHLGHDPRDRVHLAVLCPACHARHDTPQRVAAARRSRAKRSGQGWLTDELACAADPVWAWPPWARQLRLF